MYVCMYVYSTKPATIALPMAMVGCPKSLGDMEEHSERLRKKLRSAGIVVQRFVPVPAGTSSNHGRLRYFRTPLQVL